MYQPGYPPPTQQQPMMPRPMARQPYQTPGIVPNMGGVQSSGGGSLYPKPFQHQGGWGDVGFGGYPNPRPMQGGGGAWGGFGRGQMQQQPINWEGPNNPGNHLAGSLAGIMNGGSSGPTGVMAPRMPPPSPMSTGGSPAGGGGMPAPYPTPMQAPMDRGNIWTSPTQAGAPFNFVQGIGDKAWGAGNMMNRGQLDPTGTKIWLGAGGGEQGSWQNYNPNDPNMKANADMFNRYGSNWTSGSAGAYGHGSDMAAQFQALTGRQGTPQELSDLYYGVDPAKSQAAFNAFSNQSAAYNPSSSSFDPNLVANLTSLNLNARR